MAHMQAYDENDEGKTLEFLSDSGANFSIQNNLGDNVLHVFVRRQASLIKQNKKLLQKHRRLLFVKNKKGETPMDVLREKKLDKIAENPKKLKKNQHNPP